MKCVALAAFASIGVAFVGCSSSNDPQPVSTSRSTANPSPTLAPPTPGIEGSGDNPEALIARAVDASRRATAYQSTISLSLSMDGAGVQRYTGEMHQRAPTDLFISLNIDGQRIEVLALPPELFVRQQGGSWCSIPDDAKEEFRSLAEGQSIEEFADLLINLEEVADLGIETIAAVSYVHLQGEFDLADYIRDLPSGQVDASTLASTRFLRPGTVDVYIDPATDLLGRLDLDILFSSPDGDLRMIFHADFDAYNDESGFPAKPEATGEFDGTLSSC